MSQIAIIGGGHNGLAAAIVLAKAGHNVSVYEAKPHMGGLAARHSFGSQYAVPGLLTDTTKLRWDIAKQLGLEEFGLTPGEDTAITVPRKAGEPITLFADRVSGVNAADQSKYSDFAAWHDQFTTVINGVMSQPPISTKSKLWTLIRQGLAIRGLGAATLTELIRVGPMCVADWMRDTFEDEQLGAALSLQALSESFAGPWSAGTAANLLIGRILSGPPVRHGSPTLAEALIEAAKTAGVRLHCNSKIAKINLEDAKVNNIEMENGQTIKVDVVFSAIDPKQCFLKLVGAHRIPLALAEDMQKYRSRGTVALLHLGIEGALKLKDGTSVSRLRTTESLDAIEQAFDPIKYGKAAKRPVLDIRAWSCGKENLGPEGHYVLSAMVYCVPHTNMWTKESRQNLLEAAVQTLEEHCPNIRTQIRESELLTPSDLEEKHLLTGGHLYHGEHVIDQLLFMRPSVDCKHYQTPIEGLILCGSGSHPGGGLTLAPGWLAANHYLQTG